MHQETALTVLGRLAVEEGLMHPYYGLLRLGSLISSLIFLMFGAITLEDPDLSTDTLIGMAVVTVSMFLLNLLNYYHTRTILHGDESRSIPPAMGICLGSNSLFRRLLGTGLLMKAISLCLPELILILWYLARDHGSAIPTYWCSFGLMLFASIVPLCLDYLFYFQD